MSHSPLLAFYCFVLFLVSFLGGRIGFKLNLRHKTLQLSLSFVSGLVLGIALLHLLPEAIHHTQDEKAVGYWLLGGLLFLFFLERLFSFHQHEQGHSDKSKSHNIPWKGVVFGLTIHSLLAGLALGAATTNGKLGIGVMLAIALHKPFDAFAITTLMRNVDSRFFKELVNVLFALVAPLGALAFYWGFSHPDGYLLGATMAFCAGVFLCISLSDLLPELQFHSHDRLPMSLILCAGVTIAWLTTLAEH